jgi:hypothetical protein
VTSDPRRCVPFLVATVAAVVTLSACVSGSSINETSETATEVSEPAVTVAPTTTSPASTAAATTLPPVTTIPPTTTLPAPEPAVFRGQGSDVIPLGSSIEGALLARVSHNGNRNFIVVLLDEGGRRVDGIVNEIGSYSGTHAVNFDGRRSFSFIQIDADGSWELVLDRVASANVALTNSGSSFEGQGTDVVIFVADGPKTIQIQCPTCERNFIVTAWGESRRGLVNEIGAYSGRVLVPAGNLVLEVRAGANRNQSPPRWTITVD